MEVVSQEPGSTKAATNRESYPKRLISRIDSVFAILNGVKETKKLQIFNRVFADSEQ